MRVNVLAFGLPGTGKTHALARGTGGAGRSVLLPRMQDLLDLGQLERPAGTWGTCPKGPESEVLFTTTLRRRSLGNVVFPHIFAASHWSTTRFLLLGVLWHMNRVADIFINTRLQSQPELWVMDDARWHWRLKYSTNEKGRGLMGLSSEEIAQWVAPSREVQTGYFEAVKSSAREYITSLTAEDLERPVTFPPEAQKQDHSVATALGQLVWDNVAHGGQIAYLRGLFTGLGWHR